MKVNNSIFSIIPNVLTLFRGLAAIVLPVIIIYGGEIGALMATPILILAGISDYFDGFYARKYNVTSNFGKILDPVADKLLVIGVIFALASENMLDYYYDGQCFYTVHEGGTQYCSLDSYLKKWKKT